MTGKAAYFHLVSLLVLACTFTLLAACSKPNLEPTATGESRVTIRGRQTGIFGSASTERIWVRSTNKVDISASDIATAHSQVLSGESVTFTDKIAAISPFERTALLSVQTDGGAEGIALIREDGYKMALHIISGQIQDVGQTTFMTDNELALVLIANANGPHILALNNYGRSVFELPVSSVTGRIRYSPSEPDFLVIDRSIRGEIELVPYESPGETIIIADDSEAEETTSLYAETAALISDWK